MAQDPQQVIGWHGIKARVFDDWAVVGFGGDDVSGSMRIDSGGGPGFENIAGLEMRWSQSKGKQTDESLKQKVQPLLRSAEKSGKKAGISSSIVLKSSPEPGRPEREVSISFSWNMDRSARGKIFYCSVCSRVTVAVAFGKSGSQFTRQAKSVLETVECHPSVPGLTTWGLYGLLVDIPSEYRLVHQQLMNVYLQLKFETKNSVNELMVEQWSIANVQLKGAYLDEWYDSKSIGWTDGVRSEKEEAEVNAHPALSIVGRRSKPVAVVIETFKSYSRFKRPALNYSGVLWECPESNKATLIQAFSAVPGSELVYDCARRTTCHAVSVECT